MMLSTKYGQNYVPALPGQYIPTRGDILPSYSKDSKGWHPQPAVLILGNFDRVFMAFLRKYNRRCAKLSFHSRRQLSVWLVVEAFSSWNYHVVSAFPRSYNKECTFRWFFIRKQSGC